MTDWMSPRPDPVRPVGLSVYCADPPQHAACPGYSTTPTAESVNTVPSTCRCDCHQEDR